MPFSLLHLGLKHLHLLVLHLIHHLHQPRYPLPHISLPLFFNLNSPLPQSASVLSNFDQPSFSSHNHSLPLLTNHLLNPLISHMCATGLPFFMRISSNSPQSPTSALKAPRNLWPELEYHVSSRPFSANVSVAAVAAAPTMALFSVVYPWQFFVMFWWFQWGKKILDSNNFLFI